MPRTLSDSEVMGILDDHERGMSAIGIAAKYGTTRMNVYFIVTRRTHREVAEKWEEDRGGITEAELGAMIAEQMKDLPKWWHNKQAAHGDGVLPDPLPRALAFTRGVRAFNRRRGRE